MSDLNSLSGGELAEMLYVFPQPPLNAAVEEMLLSVIHMDTENGPGLELGEAARRLRIAMFDQQIWISSNLRHSAEAFETGVFLTTRRESMADRLDRLMAWLSIVVLLTIFVCIGFWYG